MKNQGMMRSRGPMKIIVLTAFAALSASALGQSYQSRIYEAYLQGRMDWWKETMDRMEQQLGSSGDLSLMYELTEVQYGYIGYCLSMKKKREAEAVLDQAENQVKRLLAIGGDNARVYSLQGAFYGYRIQLQPVRAPYFGRKSEEANRKALEVGPDEPQAWMERGNIEYYKPAIFGGSKSAAVPYYEKAISLYESTPGRTRQNWVYLNCLAGLAMAYEETGAPGKAGEVYRKLLRMEPGFKWVRDELYPQYLENHSGQ
jgi:tetratricopeptide (TPR) repeat protein